jgi:hypothetical protein
MIKQSILKRTQPLFYNAEGTLVVSKGHKIYIFSNNEYNFLFELPIPTWKKLASVSKLWSRLVRYGVMTGIEYDGAYYLTFNGHIYRYDKANNLLELDYSFENGRGPLSFTKIENLKGFKNGLYFGEYIANRSKKEVNVLMRDESWDVIYTFPKGELNHIHGLVADKLNDVLWLLAGDFDSSAALYSITNNFKNVEAILKGEQKYRACVAFSTKDGLLYATDTQMEQNSIRLLRKQDNKWVSDKLFDLNGSCIYGCEVKDYYVFSTSTEPCEKQKNKWAMLFDNKPSPAIKNNRSDVITCSKTTLECNEVRQFDKDIFPYRIFQFGTVTFPKGLCEDNLVYMYSVGGKKMDLCTEVLNLK